MDPGTDLLCLFVKADAVYCGKCARVSLVIVE